MGKVLGIGVALALGLATPASAGYLHDARARLAITHEHQGYVRHHEETGFEIAKTWRDHGRSVWAIVVMHDDQALDPATFTEARLVEHAVLHRDGVITVRFLLYTGDYTERL